ncbi:MAG: hypothetical protein PHH16_04465 [Candidatus Gracilibacteria bacterium]|nr:hypothetical protein [Candidatus Gracilibacteria bacterium]
MFTKDGRAIINGHVVPCAEIKVLRILVQLNGGAIVPTIALRMDKEFSDASLYTLLMRLSNRELVIREEVFPEVAGRPVRRVKWTACEEVIDFFVNSTEQSK